MKNNNPLRALARSNYWQIFYNKSKDLGFKIFDNNENLSKIQMIFLSYLDLYSSLNQDILMGEKYIDCDKLKNDELVDAYIVWKKEERKTSGKKRKDKKQNNTSVPSMVFTKSRKR